MLKKIISVVLAVMMAISCTFMSISTVNAKTSDWTTQSVIWDGTTASSFAGGDGTATNPYKISNGRELAYLLQTNNSGTSYAGKYIVITSDIYLNDVGKYTTYSSNSLGNKWSGLNDFAGTIDGRNHTIFGLCVEGTEKSGFINNTADLPARDAIHIKNLNFDKFYVKGNQYVGCVIGYAKTGTIENCIIGMGNIRKNYTSSMSWSSGCGGCVGSFSSGGNRGLELRNIKNYATICGYCHLGGIVGYASVGNSSGSSTSGNGNEKIIIEDCINYGRIEEYLVDDYMACAGGIGGYVSRSLNCSGVFIDRLGNEGTINGQTNTGGLFGNLNGSYQAITMCNSYNTGNISGKNNVGGLIGNYNNTGYYYTSPRVFYNNYNVGNVSGSGKICGGLIGKMIGAYVFDCYNMGIVTGNEMAYIFVGDGSQGWENSTVGNCYYLNNNSIGTMYGCFNNTVYSFTEAEKNVSSTYKTFDFTNIWEMSDNYPILRWQNQATTNTIDSGMCGDSVRWELGENNKLRIYGNGDMYDYSSFTDTPWYGYSACIEEVEIDNGVSSIGKNAFAFFISLQKVTIGNSVSSIRENAFEYCTQLNEVELPESVGMIGKRAFMSSGMQTIIFNGNAPQFDDKPFENVIADAYYDSNKTGWVNVIDTDLGGELDWYDINSPDSSTIKTKHISYHKEHWYSSNALPQIPSNDISEYAEELYEWAVKYGVSDVLTKDKAKEVVEKYMPTVLYAEEDIVAIEKEYKVWEIMRDVLMLNSTKKSLDKWEHDYLVSSEIKDLTEIQKKLAEIMDVYSSYTENCRNNPVAEVVYNILSQATGYDRDKTVFEMAKEKLSDDLKDEVLTIIQNGDLSSLEEKVDDLMELKLAWKEDGASSLKGYLWDIKENMTLDNAGKFVKNLAKKDFQHLIDTFMDEHPNIKLLRDIYSETTSYVGLFKKYPLIAEFCPGAFLAFELLHVGQTLLQTVEDTKSAQYFMLQYYAYSHSELYDALIQPDGSIIDYVDWIMKKNVEGVQSTPFLEELLAAWYKTGSQSVSTSSRIKLAGYAYNAATIQDMDIRYLQQSIVDFCVNEVSENKSGIGQVTFTTNSNNGFKIKSGDTVVGTYNNGIFTQNGNSSENTNYNAIENNRVVITQNTDQSAVSVTLRDTSYQVVFDNQISPVAVSIINEDGTQQAEIYDSNSTETTYSFNTGSLRVSDTNNNTVQSSGSYLKESSMAVLDADNIVIGYAPNDSISSVTSNITLPSIGYFGSTISWYSSNPNVVCKDGSVKRQTSNCEVTLTATIKNGNSYCERNYIFTVIGTDITVNIVLNGRYKTNYKTIAGSTLNINNLCSHIGLTKNNSCEWYFDEDKIYPIQNGCKINNNMTLYAFAKEYSITVNQQTGGNIDIGQKTTALHGETVTLTAVPDEGYVVEKVMYGNNEADRNGNNSFSFVMPSENVIISAEYKIGQYTITFDTNGGSEIAAITQDYNTVIAKPENPIKDNAIFNGWSTAIPEKMPAQNMTIIAQWIELTKIGARTANCTQNGNIEYYAGSDNKFYLLSNEVFTETEWNKIVINAIGHDYVLDDELTTDESHILICTHCGDTVIQEHQYDENNVCTVCGYGENTELIDWSKAVIKFTNNSNGLYAYNKKVIYPEFTITYNGVVLKEYEDFDFTEDAETESKYSGKHTITIFDKNDETNTFSFDYYIYNLGIVATETVNSDNKIKFTATRNADNSNIIKFGIVFDRKGTFANSLSLENRTNISTTTKKSTSKYNVNVADSGKGVYSRPYMQVTLNGENYIVYGEIKFFTRYTPEQIAVPTIQDIEPQLVNGKVSVKVQKPVYDTELYICKEMGILFSKNGTITSIENAQTSNVLIYKNVGNGNVSKGYVNGTKIGEQSLDNYSSYSANIGFVNGNPVYTRAYVIFTNKNTNEDIVVYGNYFITD